MVTATVPSSELVTLKSGLSVPLAALRVLWDLEDRQFDVSLTSAGKIRVCPASALTTADRDAITEYRETLRTLVVYCDEVVA